MSSASAFAETPVDLGAVAHELAGIQSAITSGATSGTLKPEAVQSLEGKQKELTDRLAKLQGSKITPDESTALQQSVMQQEMRLKSYSKTQQATRAVDPASVAPPIIEGPYGTVTTGGIGQPVASPVITPGVATGVETGAGTPAYGPTTLLPNGSAVPAGRTAPTGSITSTVPATNVTPGASAQGVAR